MQESNKDTPVIRGAKWIGAFLTLLLLAAPLLMNLANLLHGQMLVWGGQRYPNYPEIRQVYAAELRAQADRASAAKATKRKGAGKAEAPGEFDDVDGSDNPTGTGAPAAADDDDEEFGDVEEDSRGAAGEGAKPSKVDAADDFSDVEEDADQTEKAAAPSPDAPSAKVAAVAASKGEAGAAAGVDNKGLEAGELRARDDAKLQKQLAELSKDKATDDASPIQGASDLVGDSAAPTEDTAAAVAGAAADNVADAGKNVANAGGASGSKVAPAKPSTATNSGDEAGEEADIDDDELPDLDAPKPAAAVKPGATKGVTAAKRSAKKKVVLTEEQRSYCKLEHNIAKMTEIRVEWMPITMALLLLFAALVATIRRHHIALRSATTAFEDRASNLVQALANGLTAASSYAMLSLAEGMNWHLHALWMGGLVLLMAVNLAYLIFPLRGDAGAEAKGVGLKVLATIPLYTYMALVSGAYFFLFESYPSGTAVYLGKLSENSILYVQVGLYLWTGMLLRDTTVGQLFFDLVRPFRPPPELFAVLVVIVAAVPTAYSGASGILVLALGATIFTELRRAGASQQRSLAATAMSGSLGVVLPPCLLVVIVASLNLDVTTDELFHWGWRVFGLTTLLFAIISFIARKNSWRLQPPAIGDSEEFFGALVRLAPYVILSVAVVLLFGKVFNAGLDEYTAPYVLPVVMMALIPWDRWRLKRAKATGVGPADDSGTRRATLLDSATHIGALLMLMGLSACLGGVIERSEIVGLFPQDLGSPYVAMTLLMVVLVLIGMVMDPYGAVILVTVTLYPIAKAHHIHPLNFWMTALVSFELGYLTPPVALNHLLTRQVVQGLDEFDEEEKFPEGASLWRRYERILLPIAVLATTLLVVAFGPIIYGARAG